MVTRFWWLRHGPTHEKAFLGWRDVGADLSDTDALQRLNAHLPADAIVVSSDLSRASQTAGAIAALRYRLPDDPALREFDFGTWDGLSFDQVAARDPDLSRSFWDRPGDIAPPGGESWNAVARRARRAVVGLTKAHPGRDIVAVAHIGTIMTQIGQCAGQSPMTAIAHQIDPLSVTRIDIARDRACLVSVNHRP